MKPLVKTYVALSIALAVAGCATNAPFRSADADYFLSSGGNSIAGIAKMVVGDTRTYTCALNGAILMPVTNFTSARMMALFQAQNHGFADATTLEQLHDDNLPAKYVRHASCDQNGRFAFGGIADGQYYVQADIFWITGGPRRPNHVHGGSLMEMVRVSGSEHKELELLKEF